MKVLTSRFSVVAVMLLLSSTLAFSADKQAPAVKEPAKQAATPDKVSTAKAVLVDINSATESELKAIPGVGDTYAKKIVEGRPYVKKDQLKSRKIVPDAVYEKIKDKIIAKQAKK